MESEGFHLKPLAELTEVERPSHLYANDLRGTATTLLAESGRTLPQIVSITDHIIQASIRIIARYPSMTPALPKAAMTAFENARQQHFQTSAERA